MKKLMIMICLLAITACSQMSGVRERTVSSSLMDFLYPDEASRQEHQPQVPTLKLPVTIGVAFVPSPRYRDDISYGEQMQLLEKVKSAFDNYEYIERIELIPNSYLSGGKGFSTLQQVARLHDVDLMALISYDQVEQSFENHAALLYWTIAGMYVIPGNDNSVQTFVDTAVFDVASNKLLFRAPGISKLEKLSTAIGVSETKKEQSSEGFNLAMEQMIVNLDAELARFKTRVKEEKIANIEHKSGYRGGALCLLPLFGLLLWGVRRRRA